MDQAYAEVVSRPQSRQTDLEYPASLIEIRADLVSLWYQLCWVQRSPIVIFSFIRALWQFDFLVMNLLVGNETQDV